MNRNQPVQLGLFDLPAKPEEPEPEQTPIEGVTTWERISRKLDCADCSWQQADDYAAGRPTQRRERARIRMISGSDTVSLCDRHARRRGWKGRS